MWTFSNDGFHDRLILRASRKFSSLTECIEEVIKCIESTFVRRVCDDREEHNQSFVRWAVGIKFRHVTGQNFPHLSKLVFRYIRCAKPLICHGYYTDLYQFLSPHKRESKYHYKLRVIAKYVHLVPLFSIQCENPKYEKWIHTCIMEYFALATERAKSAHLKKCNCVVEGKIQLLEW